MMLRRLLQTFSEEQKDTKQAGVELESLAKLPGGVVSNLLRELAKTKTPKTKPRRRGGGWRGTDEGKGAGKLSGGGVLYVSGRVMAAVLKAVAPALRRCSVIDISG
jgi:hypothetical protein